MHHLGGAKMTKFYVCTNCQRTTAYKKSHCQNCGQSSFDTIYETRGTLVAASTIQKTPPGIQSPHHIGLISFENGASIIIQLEEYVEPVTEVEVDEISA